MWGIWSDWSACWVAAGIPGGGHEQDRIAALGGPAGRGHRVRGVRGGGDHDVRARLAGGGARELVDCRGERVRPVPGDRRAAQALDRGDVADPDHLGSGGLARAGRGEQVERVGGRRRERRAAGQQDRRADRRRHQHGCRDRRLPIVGGRDRHRGRVGAGGDRGNTASATPAASEIGSTPETRVVFFVASTGKPRLAAGARGARARGRRPDDQPGGTAAAARDRHQASRRAAAIAAVHRMRPHVSGAQRGSPHSGVRTGTRNLRENRSAAAGAEGSRRFVNRYIAATPNPRASTSAERGTQVPWGESRGEPAGGAGSFSASPSANPAGPRKRVLRVPD